MKKQKVALILFCLYVFLIPFEHILEIEFGIITKLKPYRILAIVFIIFHYLFYPRGRGLLISNKTDFLIILTLFFGLLISFYHYIFGTFNVALFQNVIIQVSLGLLVYIIAKQKNFSIDNLKLVLIVFSLGVILNNAKMLFDFFNNIPSLRQKGYMTSSNTTAFLNSIVVFFFFYLIKTKSFKNIIVNALLLLLILFLFGGVFLTGSRAGILIILFGIVAQNFVFASLKRKLWSFFIFIVIGLFFTNKVGSIDFFSNNPLINRVNAIGMKKDIRQLIWAGGWLACKDTYFMGLGIAQFPDGRNFYKYMSNVDSNLAMKYSKGGLGLHNDYLGVLVEYGIIAFLSFMLFHYFSFRKLWKYFLHKRKKNKNWVSFLIVCYLSLLIYGMFSSNFLNHGYWLVLLIGTSKIDKI